MNANHRGRRRCVLAGAAALALGATGARAAPFDRLSSRARFSLATDFSIPPDVFSVVPWNVTDFQAGADVALQSDGKVLIRTTGLYACIASCDWDATYGTDIDMRKLGIRRQQFGQADEPVAQHQRLGFVNIPGSDPPQMARYQGEWNPVSVPMGGVVTTEIKVTPPGVVLPGDMAQASHTRLTDKAIGAEAVNALVVQAKVVAADTVRVTLYNPIIASGIDVPQGTLKVIAMNAVRDRGPNSDAWQVLHSASVELSAGDRVYAMIEHKVQGTLLQATRSSYLQIDRLA